MKVYSFMNVNCIMPLGDRANTWPGLHHTEYRNWYFDEEIQRNRQVIYACWAFGYLYHTLALELHYDEERVL